MKKIRAQEPKETKNKKKKYYNIEDITQEEKPQTTEPEKRIKQVKINETVLKKNSSQTQQ